MKVLQINVSANSGSHGRIADEIGGLLIERGHDNIIAYGRTANNSKSTLIKIGSSLDLALHLVKTRLFDLHGFGSSRSTHILTKQIEAINPDLIHLHNLHGYYLNIEALFTHLKNWNKPVVWTFHDCWPFTGHCSHFMHVNCNKWHEECCECPNTQRYPKSWLIDNSKWNYRKKKQLFTGLEKMVLVSPSVWLAEQLKNSFLKKYEIRVINNGVDLDKFKPVDNEAIKFRYGLNKKYILGVASIWTKRKGLDDFLDLRKRLDPGIEIVLVGLKKSQTKSLPEGITGIFRTENINVLAGLYTGAEVFVNPTYVDNFPMVNIESLACGTPVITYNTGGSSEAIDFKTGKVVEKGDISTLHKSIIGMLNSKELYSSAQCRDWAYRKFSAQERFNDYICLYNELLSID